MALHLRDHEWTPNGSPTHWEMAFRKVGLTLESVGDDVFPSDPEEIKALSREHQCIVLHSHKNEAWIRAFESPNAKWRGTLVLVSARGGGLSKRDEKRRVGTPHSVQIQGLLWTAKGLEEKRTTTKAQMVIRWLRERSGGKVTT